MKKLALYAALLCASYAATTLPWGGSDNSRGFLGSIVGGTGDVAAEVVGGTGNVAAKAVDMPENAVTGKSAKDRANDRAAERGERGDKSNGPKRNGFFRKNKQSQDETASNATSK